MARVAARIGPVASGCERGLCAPDDFLRRAVVPRFPAGAVNPSSPKPAASIWRKQRFTTLGGLPLKAFYTRENLAGGGPQTSVGFSREFPFTRGVYSTMYRV